MTASPKTSRRASGVARAARIAAETAALRASYLELETRLRAHNLALDAIDERLARLETVRLQGK